MHVLKQHPCCSAAPDTSSCLLQGGKVEIGAPTGRWQLVIAYRGKHDSLDLTYLAALQHLMPEFEELSVDVVAVSVPVISVIVINTSKNPGPPIVA